MSEATTVIIEEGQTEARVRLDQVRGDVIFLEVRVTPGKGIEIGVASPMQASLVAATPTTPEERAAYFRTPEFRDRLTSHLTKAKEQALADIAEEAKGNGSS